MAHYAVIGRIPGDDEDSCYTFEADTREQAVEQFEAAITADLDDAAKNRLVEEYGQRVYVTHVLTAAGPIEVDSNV